LTIRRRLGSLIAQGLFFGRATRDGRPVKSRNWLGLGHFSTGASSLVRGSFLPESGLVSDWRGSDCWSRNFLAPGHGRARIGIKNVGGYPLERFEPEPDPERWQASHRGGRGHRKFVDHGLLRIQLAAREPV